MIIGVRSRSPEVTHLPPGCGQLDDLVDEVEPFLPVRDQEDHCPAPREDPLTLPLRHPSSHPSPPPPTRAEHGNRHDDGEDSCGRRQDPPREDEQRRHDPEDRIGAECDASGVRATEEARIERSHVSECTAGSGVARGPAAVPRLHQCLTGRQWEEE